MQSARRTDTPSGTRLDSVERMALLYTPAEECFDRITRLASRVMRTPVAVLSIMGHDRAWFKSRVGLQVNEVALDDPLITDVMATHGSFVVQDALATPRYARSGLVVNAPFARYFAGTAVRAPDGSRIGALSVLDTEPRSGVGEDLPSLRDLVSVAEGELHRRQLTFAQGDMIRELGEARRRSMVDPLTSVWNRAGLDTILTRELDAAGMRGSELSVAMVDLDHFKGVNDRFGHAVGDTVLCEVARRQRVAARPVDSVARYGGEEFVVVLPGCGAHDVQRVAQRLRGRIADAPVVVGQSLQLDVTASIGIATAEPGEPASVLLTRADVALYDAKRNGRDQVVIAQPSMRAPGPR
jgi:diguanylate cyclase (GGDEF)-like protein